ncbi:MAG: hypothetical protein AB8C46_22540 [Burkholderiaceae bacterium]
MKINSKPTGLRGARLLMTSIALAAIAACGGGDGSTDGGGGGSMQGEANVSLRSLSYTDSGNWQYRIETQTTFDATADSNGNFARTERYTRSENGAPTSWRFGPDPERANDLFYNGQTWRQCEDGYRTTIGPLIDGTRQFNYCDMYAVGEESIIRTDISGQQMSAVIAEIRNTLGGDGFTEFSEYGPVNLGVLGSATFPEGSFKENVLRTTNAYNPRYTNEAATQVRAYNLDIANGGDARSNGSIACANLPITATIDDIAALATNLEQIIGAARGTPCVFNPVSNSVGSSVNPHEWWGPSTIEFGELIGENVDVRPAGTGDYYKESPSLRVAFSGGTSVNYYECLVRRSVGGNPESIRNCTLRGTGSYAIDMLGDARVMSFSNPPPPFDDLTVDRALIERDGAVYAGIIEREGVNDEVGFNGIASEALLRQLLLPVPEPIQ